MLINFNKKINEKKVDKYLYGWVRLVFSKHGKKFDSHVKKSIPFYDEVHEYV